MATQRNESEIIEVEKAFWKSIQDKDIDTALRLTDDVSIVTGAQGVASIDHKQYAEMAKSDLWTLQRFEFLGKPEVRFITDDVAVIGYKVREEMTVEGKPLTLEAAQASTWVRKDGQWKCVLHTESLLGDPFGRDRFTQPSTGKGLADQPAVANLAVKDVGAARTFYEKTIGLTPVAEQESEMVVYKSGNSTLNVYHSDYAGTNKATAVTWEVGNIEDSVKDLKSKGITFEHYDMPDTRLEGDIHIAGDVKLAWFKDPDGNILNLLQQ